MTLKVICIKHPKYDGKQQPSLNCKTCCSLYISWLNKDSKKVKQTSQNAKDKVGN